MAENDLIQKKKKEGGREKKEYSINTAVSLRGILKGGSERSLLRKKGKLEGEEGGKVLRE